MMRPFRIFLIAIAAPVLALVGGSMAFPHSALAHQLIPQGSLEAGGNLAKLVATTAATGAAVPASAVYHGGIATTATPAKASAGNIVGAQMDVQGRMVVTPVAPRELTGMQSTTLTATTTATTCVTLGAAGVKNDITSIVFVNSSATGTVMTLSDGTNSYTYYCAPTSQSPTVVYLVPLAETTAATAWTAKCTTSVSSVFVTITYVKNE